MQRVDFDGFDLNQEAERLRSDISQRPFGERALALFSQVARHRLIQQDLSISYERGVDYAIEQGYSPQEEGWRMGESIKNGKRRAIMERLAEAEITANPDLQTTHAMLISGYNFMIVRYLGSLRVEVGPADTLRAERVVMGVLNKVRVSY